MPSGSATHHTSLCAGLSSIEGERQKILTRGLKIFNWKLDQKIRKSLIKHTEQLYKQYTFIYLFSNAVTSRKYFFRYIFMNYTNRNCNLNAYKKILLES